MPRPRWFLPAVAAVALGLVFGWRHGTLLDSVEIAQVASGVVSAAPESPPAIYQRSVISVVVEAESLLLRAGASEFAISRAGSALIAAFAALACSLAAFAWSRSRAVALAMPLLMLGWASIPSHRYPILYPLSNFDMGLVGFFAALMVLALLALRVRAGVFLLAALPAIHITWAAGVWGIVAAGAIVDRRILTYTRRHWRWFVSGLLAVGVVAVPVVTRTAGDVSPLAESLTRAFIVHWDSHFTPRFAGAADGFLAFVQLFAIDACFVTMAAFAWRGRSVFPRSNRFWLAGQVALTIVVILVALVEWLAPGHMPVAVTALMAKRWLNLNSVVLGIATIGLCFYRFDRPPRALAAVVVGLVLASLGATGFGTEIGWRLRNDARGLLPVWSTIAALAAIGVVAFIARHRRSPSVSTRRALPAALLLAFALLTAARTWPDTAGADANSDTQTVMRLARTRTGSVFLSEPSIEHVQLQMRRPLVLNPQLLDTLPYCPQAAPATEDVLNRVYGVSLMSPEGARQFDQLQARWEAREADEWARLGLHFGATDVAVPGDWHLQLPLIARSDEIALYAIKPAP